MKCMYNKNQNREFSGAKNEIRNFSHNEKMKEDEELIRMTSSGAI